MFRNLCGESTLKNVVFVTNMWNEDSQDANEAREKELSDKFFRPALDGGAQMARHHNTIESAHDIIRRIIDNHPVVLQIQRELVDERKDISDTAAGETINRELKEQVRRYQAELRELREEVTRALEEKDEEMREKLAEAKGGLQKRLEKIEKDLKTMAANYTAEREEVEARMEVMGREVRQEREQSEAESDQELAISTDRLQYTPNAAEVDGVGEQEIKKLQDRITIPIY